MDIRDELRRHGWGSGFHLPIANRGNCILEKQLEEKQLKTVHLRNLISKEDQLIKELKNQITRSSSAFTNLMKISEAQKKSLENSSHLAVSSKLRVSSIAKEIGALQKDVDEKRKRNNVIKTDLENRQRRIDDASEQVQWNKEEVALTAKLSKQSELGIEELTKVFKMDDDVIKEAEASYKKVQEESATLKQELSNSLNESKSLETVLTRISKQFSSIHNSRNEALDLWKSVIDSLQNRDRQLDQIGKEYVQELVRLNDFKIILLDKKKFFQVQQENLLELNNYFQLTCKVTTELRHLISNDVKQIKGLKRTQSVLRLDIEQLGNTLKQRNSTKIQRKEEASTIEDKEFKILSELEILRKQYRQFQNGTLNTDDKFREAGTLLDFEEEFYDALKKEIEKRHQLQLRLRNKNYAMKEELEQLVSEAKRFENELKAGRIMSERNTNLIMNRGRAYYKLELAILKLERRLAIKLENTENIERSKVAKEKAEKLRMEQVQFQLQKIRLDNLNGHMNSVVQRLSKDILRLKEESQKMVNENEALNALVHSHSKEHGEVTKVLHQAKLELQLLLLNQYRMRQVLEKRMEKIFDAGKEQIYLKAVASERILDIQNRISTSEFEKRKLMDDRAKLIQSVNEIRTSLKNLKTKYDFALNAMGESTISDGTKVSEAFFLIKTAQEREFLRREGEKWDQLVKEAETEVQGLQNTLSLMSNSNNIFRSNMITGQSTELSSEIEITSKLISVKLEMKSELIQKLNCIQHDISHEEQEIAKLELEIQQSKDVLGKKRQELQLLIQEIQGQDEKLERANLMTKRLVRSLGSSITANTQAKQGMESEIKLRCLREKYHFTIKTLQKTLSAYPKLLPWLFDYCEKHSILAKLKLLEKFQQKSIE